MKSAIHQIERQIARVNNECSVRRDLHGRGSTSYRTKRAELAQLRSERRVLKIEAVRGQVVA